MKGKREEGKKAEKRSRLLVCFRPAVVATDPQESLAGGTARSDPSLKTTGLLNEPLSSPKRKNRQSPNSSECDECCRKRFRPLSGIKMAIFGSGKGASRSGKVQQDPSRSSHTAESVSDEPIHQERPRKSTGSIIQKTDSSIVTTSTSSSSCSVLGVSQTSICSSRRKLYSPTTSVESQHSVLSPPPRFISRETPSPTRETGEATRTGLDPIIGLCYLLVISFLTTLIWGQIPAIICTSIWLYFADRTRVRLWPGNRRREESPSDPPGIRSKDAVNGSSWRASWVGATTTTTSRSSSPAGH